MSCAALLLATQISACAPAIKSYEHCADSETNLAASFDRTTLDEDSNDRHREIRKVISQLNRTSDAQVACEIRKRRAERLCGDSEDFERARAVVRSNLFELANRQQSLLIRARQKMARDSAALALNCLPTNVEGVTGVQCRVLDRTRPHARIISSEDAGELPLTVGESAKCSFTVLPDGRLLTADHCGPDSLDRGLVFAHVRATPITARFESALKVDPSRVFGGMSFEDLSVWKATSAIRGRPFYILVRDTNRRQGCEIVDDLYLSCAPLTLAELHRREAHVLGYPQVRYPRRDRAETVLMADGDLYFDPDGDRFLVHAAVSWGASGGPVYLDAGQSIGGVFLKRPLYIGPVSGFAPPNPRPEVFNTDTLAIVGIYDSARMRAAVPPN